MARQDCYIRYTTLKDINTSCKIGSGDVITQFKNMTIYSDPMYNLNAYEDNEGHEHVTYGEDADIGNVAIFHGGGSYITPYILEDGKQTAIIFLYRLRKYKVGEGKTERYLFGSGIGDKKAGVCFVNDKKTLRVYKGGDAGGSNIVNIMEFPTSYHNPCLPDRWNVICAVYDRGVHSRKSSIWVNGSKLANFETDTKGTEEILLFNSIYRRNGEGFNGFIKLVEIYPRIGKGGGGGGGVL